VASPVPFWAVAGIENNKAANSAIMSLNGFSMTFSTQQ
jgi:hypothetical protein